MLNKLTLTLLVFIGILLIILVIICTCDTEAFKNGIYNLPKLSSGSSILGNKLQVPTKPGLSNIESATVPIFRKGYVKEPSSSEEPGISEEGVGWLPSLTLFMPNKIKRSELEQPTIHSRLYKASNGGILKST